MTGRSVLTTSIMLEGVNPAVRTSTLNGTTALNKIIAEMDVISALATRGGPI